MKTRLSLMNFLEFAVWGAYLTCMGNYLGVAGLGDKISWFYAIQGIVSLFMPTLMGIVADKYIQPQRLLGLCHLLAGGFMLGCWGMGFEAGFGNELTDKTAFIALYTLSVAFFMPTIALANTTAFTILKNNGLDTVKDFPPIRVLGTVGFILTMWFVNCAVWEDGAFTMTLSGNAHKFQYTYMQFFVVGHVSPGHQRFCWSVPDEFQSKFRSGYRRLVCCRQCHSADLYLSDQRGAMHTDDSFLPQTIWHQGRYADVNVCLGVPFWLLWYWSSYDAWCHHVYPLLYRLWCRLRLLQCLGRYLCRSGV